MDPSLPKVQQLTVYKQSRNLLGIRWAIPNGTQENNTKLNYQIKYTLDSANWKFDASPDKCVPWLNFTATQSHYCNPTRTTLWR